MKILFLCGIFDKEQELEIVERAKRAVEFSANIFQEKMIGGFKRLNCDFRVISAPFIGSYPIASSIRYFKKCETSSNDYTYVKFNNLWGIRNYSRARSLKKALYSFAESKNDKEKMIVVYSPHTPFLEAAVYAKKIDKSIKICLVVPDLPQYMNLNTKISNLYKIGKKLDIHKFNKLNKKVDSYMLLTEPMKEKIDIRNRPYIVSEGIIDELPQYNNSLERELENINEKYIVYTGKLNERFGVKDLVDAFGLIEDPNYRLVLCGKGDIEKYAREKSQTDPRIMCLGQVSPDEAKQWISRAKVLVNPRRNDEEYTKYSFPSKNIEYLLSGKPVVAYMLDGMLPIYREFLCEVKGNGVKALAEAILSALNTEGELQQIRQKQIKEYFQTLKNDVLVQKLIDITFEGNKI